MTSPQEPRRVPPCEQCDGTQVGGLAQRRMGIDYKRTRLGRRPVSELNARVCLDCGRVSLFADDLATLRQMTEKHPERFVW